MNVRLTRNPLFALAVCALSGSIALSQQAPPAPAATAPAPAAAPIERQPPPNRMRPDMRQGMRPGMMQGGMRPGMQGNFRGHMDRSRGHMHGGFRSGMAGGFRGGHGGSMGGGFHIGPGGMWWKNPSVVQRLALTPDQTRKMDDIFQQSRIQLIDLRADVQKQEVMLEPLLSASTLDSAKATAQIDRVADARANLEKANAKMLLGIRGVLTPDQWTKLRTRGGPGGPGGEQGGPGGPAGAAAPGGGRGRGMRGGQPPSTSNLVDPVDQP
jgi:Spy/CpxP family protein refolding chaperone